MKDEYFFQSIIAVIVMVTTVVVLRTCAELDRDADYNRFEKCMKQASDLQLCRELLR